MTDKTNPQHYKIGNNDLIDVIQEAVNDFGSVCQANIMKYSFRANKKHKSPEDDIKKIIRYGEFWLNHIQGKKASDKQDHKLKTVEEVEQVHELLSDQEKFFLKFLLTDSEQRVDEREQK